MRIVNGTFFIFIEDIADGIPRGFFLNADNQQKVQFSDLGNMVLKINRVLQETVNQNRNQEAVWHPSAEFFFQRRRYFFLLEVLYMEHSSWQGRLAGTNCPRTCFKSVLDLLRIMKQGMEEPMKVHK